MPSCGCIAREGYSNNSMVSNVSLLWRRMDGCEAESRGVVGGQLWKKRWNRFSRFTHFAANMPSCGGCFAEGYSNNSMVRAVRVLWRRKDGCEAISSGVGGVQKWERWRYRFASSTYLQQICYHMAALLEKGTAITAWSGLWECSGEERMDVRQNQGVWWVFSCGKSDETDFLDSHTLLQICDHVVVCCRRVRQ